jgi:hypothetical protein
MAQMDGFFPKREWTKRRRLTAGLYVLHAHVSDDGGDVALTFTEHMPVGMRGTVITLSEHGESELWLRARHLSADAISSWQMRRNHRGKMEFRSTGYHEGMGQCVCMCVGGRCPLYDYMSEVFGEERYASFAVAARAAIMNEIRNREVPRRLIDLLPGPGLKDEDLDEVVDTNRDYELRDEMAPGRC